MTCILIPVNKLQHKWTDKDTRISIKCIFQIEARQNCWTAIDICLHVNIATNILLRRFLSNEKEYKCVQMITKLSQYLSFSF